MKNILLMCALITTFFVGGMWVGWNSASRADETIREMSAPRNYGGLMVQAPFAEIASPSLAAQLRETEVRLDEYRQRCTAWAQYVWRLEHAPAE